MDIPGITGPQPISPSMVAIEQPPVGPSRPVDPALPGFGAGERVSRPQERATSRQGEGSSEQDARGSLIKELEADLGRKLEISISRDKETNRWVIKMQDPETHEVVRQIPAEEVLKLAKHLGKDTKGLIVDTKA